MFHWEANKWIREPAWVFDSGEEVLVLVIEYVGGPESQEAYFGREGENELRSQKRKDTLRSVSSHESAIWSE
jgi:hypothetical protein